ncbi:MAG: hypothetical protein APF78_00675 [Sphingomonadales bacterium BRH_c3]|nr:MAG: hypothetical protein APF78_00675 [Sphingomonadales bacterium BRH_c3]
MKRVFFSYSHADEDLRDQLEVQLSMLKRQGLIEAWHDRRIGAGNEIDGSIDVNMESSSIILLLVSPDFLASDYCYDREMTRAMERHKDGSAKVIPVILRPCDWHNAPFGKLMAVPKDGKPITMWPDPDSAFLEVARAVREVVGEASSPSLEYKAKASGHDELPVDPIEKPRSSNLRIKKEFSERDKDKFKVQTFEYMAKFFENSLDELERRNDGIECDFRQVDANRFTASIYQHGNAVARCTVFLGGDRFTGQGISFVHGETTESNSYNESISVAADEIEMYLTSFGMSAIFGGDEQKLSKQGAAELYWSLLIQPLQG